MPQHYSRSHLDNVAERLAQVERVIAREQKQHRETVERRQGDDPSRATGLSSRPLRRVEQRTFDIER